MPAIEVPRENPEEHPEVVESQELPLRAVEIAFTPSDSHNDLIEDDEMVPASEVQVLPPPEFTSNESPVEIHEVPTPHVSVATRHVVAPVRSSSATPILSEPGDKTEVKAPTRPVTTPTLKEKPEEEPAKKEVVAQPVRPTNETPVKLDKAIPQPETPALPVSKGSGGSEKLPTNPPELGGEDEGLPEKPEKPKKPDAPAEGAEANAEKVVPENASETQAESPKKSNLLFLEVSHVLGAEEEIVDELKRAKCDIAAIENFGYKDTSERQEANESYTALISSERLREIEQNPEGEVAKATAETLADDKEHAFKRALLSQLMGTDMQFELLDITRDHPSYPVFLMAEQASKDLRQGTAAHMPNNELRDLLRLDIYMWSNSSTAREAYVTAQLKELRQRYPDAKIGVVTGALHTSISHTFAAEEGQIERKFILSGLPLHKHPTEKARYPYLEQLQRELHFFPEKELDDKLVDRALLEHLFVQHVRMLEDPLSVRIKNALDFIDPLSDDEVTTVLDRLDDIKRRPPRIFGWMRTEVKMERLLIELSEERS
jgi:hypothetical protein